MNVKKVYIQTVDGIFLNNTCFTAYEGFKARRDFDIEFFTKADIEKLLTRDIYVGGINSLRAILKNFGIVSNELDFAVPSLMKYAKREVRNMTIGDLRNNLPNKKFFLKPLLQAKLFDGTPISSFADMFKLQHIPDDTQVLYSEWKNIASEYRIFVLNKEVIGCRHYFGDFRKAPNFAMIEAIIADYREQPIAYSIDVGIDDIDESFLIELNDAWAIAPYGLNPVLYSQFLQARWEELINNNGNSR